jgi:paraquat-inducible protein A
LKRRVDPSAASMGLCACHACDLVSRPDKMSGPARCPRCNARLHFRIPNSIGHCWALLIASYILYIPANVLPIMETGSLFNYRKDTIMSGVVHLWSTGSWGISVIVFIASIVVPLFKLISISLLLISVQRRSTWWPMQRARLYRLVELVGRWSMLDIYVVTLLAALVQIRSLATVRAGTGAIAFGAVVVLTMFAARKFDSRLIWDPCRKREHDDRHAPTS